MTTTTTQLWISFYYYKLWGWRGEDITIPIKYDEYYYMMMDDDDDNDDD
jgi:hypothetical protein